MSSAQKEYLLFTAYSMTSAFAQAGSCVTVSGAASPLPTPYSIAKPAVATADPAQYQSTLATWFVDLLKVPDWGICGINGSLAVHMANANTTAFVNVAVPTLLGVVPLANTATVIVTQSALPHSCSTGLGTSAKVAIGCIVAGVVVLGVLLPGTILWYRHRKQQAAVIERRTREKLDMDMDTDVPKGAAS